MSNKSTSSKVNSLLAALKDTAPDAPAPANEEPAAEPKPQARAHHRATPKPKAPTQRRGGTPAQFWLHDEDRRLIRELAAWLAGQGVRPTDSAVVRAALHTTKTGREFFEAYRQATSLDGRLKPRKSNESTGTHEPL
jgi:hypothetical protein